MTTGKRYAATLATLGLVLATATMARAICDVIPQPEAAFQGATASSNRVFAGDGDVVTLTRDAAQCEAGTPDFGATPSSDRIVTLVFTPPGGPNTAVVLGNASYCASSNWISGGRQASCEAQLGTGGVAFCATDGGLSGGSDVLRFTLRSQSRTGPVKIAVSDSAGAPACQIATQACSAQIGLSACIDELYQRDTCDTELVNRHPEFPGVTALPVWNDFEAICDSADPSIPCNNTGADVQFTTDAAGNVIVPMDWRGILVQGSLPIPRLVQANTLIPAFLTATPAVGPAPEPTQVVGAPTEVPGLGFLQSFSPRGLRVDPIFNPVTDPESTDTSFFGSADAEFGVIRVLRRSPAYRQCQAGDRADLPCITDVECPGSQCLPALCRGGSNDGGACTGDHGCPGGECGSSLFNFQDRYSVSGTGPMPITSAQYDAEALNPAAIDGLAATDDLFMFVRSEPLENKDLNLDGDQLDSTIVTLRDGASGEEFEIGTTPGAVGPAGLRVRERGFRFPAISVEDDVVALLEPEPEEGNTDANGDGDEADAILRIFRLEAGGPVELTAGENRASDPLTAIDQKSVVVSDGLVFFRESEAAGTARIQEQSDPQVPNNSTAADMTPDGRYVATAGFGSLSVLDRDVNQDGVFDAVATVVVSIGSGITVGLDLSPDGRYLVFDGTGFSLPCVNSDPRVIALDRDFDMDGIFDEYGDPAAYRYVCRSFLAGTTVGHLDPRISDDGRWLAYREIADDDLDSEKLMLVDMDPDANGLWDSFATNRLPTSGWQGERITDGPSMSADGRYLAVVSSAPYLPEDTESPTIFQGDPNPYAPDVYLLDLDHDENGTFLDNTGNFSDWIQLVTDTGSGFQTGLRRVREPTLSGDGRRLAFLARSGVLAPAGLDPDSDLFVLDRDLDEDGLFDEPRAVELRRVMRSQASILDPNDPLFDPFPELPGDPLEPRLTMSDDGRFLGALAKGGSASSNVIEMIDLRTDLAFRIQSDPLVGNHLTMLALGLGAQQYAIGSSFSNPSTLLFGGVDTADLSNDLSGDGDTDDLVLQVADARLAAPIPVATLGAAESVSVAAGNALFLQPEAAGGLSLNGDLDADDAVVHLYRNRQAGPAVNLGLAADAVAVSSQVVAALVSEAGEGALLNGDSDMDDSVVHVSDLATATSGTWTSLFLAADAVQAAGTRVAFSVPEADQAASLNGDGDQNDRVLRVYDTATAQILGFVDELGTPIPGFAIVDFALGDTVVAFRVSEADQGLDLNADGDLVDDVMHVADLTSGEVYASGQSAIPCPVDACDPRIPYRIVGTKVTFLTLEAHQGGNDLDGDGSGAGLVLQHFNPSALEAGGDMDDACDVFGSTLGGICTGSGDACASDLDCTGGDECFFPPGVCLDDTFNACDPTEDAPCFGGQVCLPTGGPDPTDGTCHTVQNSCVNDGGCFGTAFCADNGEDAERLFAAIAETPDGRQRFASLGRCSDGDGICAVDGDCNPGATCNPDETVLATAADPDADGLADPIDNCPDVPNGDQLDVDQDGIGDACDRQSCGNGVQEYTETCDHGDQNGLDGLCDASCAYVGAGPACSDGVDNDGDGWVDTFDVGCADAADTSERDAALACDDGRDNDGDYGSDAGGDPGCADPRSAREDPACSDGIDNDGDGMVDYDGFGGFYEPDPQCSGKPYPNLEDASGGVGWCGLGFELIFLLPLLRRLRTLSRRHAVS